jgi:hypothetical protein
MNGVGEGVVDLPMLAMPLIFHLRFCFFFEKTKNIGRTLAVRRNNHFFKKTIQISIQFTKFLSQPTSTTSLENTQSSNHSLIH